jgi:hypothetical protein
MCTLDVWLQSRCYGSFCAHYATSHTLRLGHIEAFGWQHATVCAALLFVVVVGHRTISTYGLAMTET